jgi:hypothetical protein
MVGVAGKSCRPGFEKGNNKLQAVEQEPQHEKERDTGVSDGVNKNNYL